MSKKKTHEEFVSEVYELVGDEYKVLSQYVGTDTKLTMKHAKCEHEYPVTPYKFISGRRCPKCFGNKKKTTEMFKREIYDLVGSEYSVKGEYNGNKTKIDMIHNTCNHEWSVAPIAFLKGNRCPKCSLSKRTKTLEQFKLEVEILSKGEYIVPNNQEYVNANTYINLKHLTCGTQYKTYPSTFLSGAKCPKCSGKMKKTTDVFKEEVEHLTNGKYSLCDGEEYINANTKIKIKHNTCGNEWDTTPTSFTSGRRCPVCGIRQRADKRRKSHDEFIQEVFNLVGDEYEVLGEYIGGKTKIEIRHNKCEKEWSIQPTNFLGGQRCPDCSKKEAIKKRTKTTYQFKLEVFELVSDEYTVLGEYVNSDTKVNMRHNKCNHDYEVSPHHFLKRGQRCPKCYGCFTKSLEKFKREVFELGNGKYVVLGEYVNDRTHIMMRHDECGHEYEVTPSSFLSGKRCPQCRSSKGEVRIKEYLNLKNIGFAQQFMFDDCILVNKLMFDFAVLYNGEIVKLIEFDGKQHFEPIEFFGGQEEFKKVQKRDQIKNDYCLKNNIPLLRIPYWDFDNIESILEKEIHNKVLI